MGTVRFYSPDSLLYAVSFSSKKWSLLVWDGRELGLYFLKLRHPVHESTFRAIKAAFLCAEVGENGLFDLSGIGVSPGLKKVVICGAA